MWNIDVGKDDRTGTGTVQSKQRYVVDISLLTGAICRYRLIEQGCQCRSISHGSWAQDVPR